MRRSLLLQVVVLGLLLLNGVHLLFFATSPVAPGDKVETVSLKPSHRGPFREKPWPELPSYSPWIANSTTAGRGCEHIFGNGFTRIYDIILPGTGHAAKDLVGIKGGLGQRKLADLGSVSRPLRLPSTELFDDVTRQPQGELGEEGDARGDPESRVGWDEAGMNLAFLGRKAGSGKFGRRYDSFLSPADASFKCAFSERLLTSICEGTRVVMDTGKLTMSKGGESMGDVLGRPDEDELPSFVPGAFSVVTNHTAPDTIVVSRRLLDTLMPQGQVHFHAMRNLLESIRTMDSDGLRCTERIKEPTLFVTRFEYANLFHTVTDWYSAYVASRVVGLKQRPRLVFVDGHCKSPLDNGWEARSKQT
eukprot:TRINITY_DN3647_c0_g1_i1.p1 TRINITY_DN3647_c0_g1~~TRINITY_DN3647_c0_g1_i1.p1  ORF type:complete len:362 (+),score=38.80 TRINITY_DN3647_c0_g1_i1:163-1248(+)